MILRGNSECHFPQELFFPESNSSSWRIRPCFAFSDSSSFRRRFRTRKKKSISYNRKWLSSLKSTPSTGLSQTFFLFITPSPPLRPVAMWVKRGEETRMSFSRSNTCDICLAMFRAVEKNLFVSDTVTREKEACMCVCCFEMPKRERVSRNGGKKMNMQIHTVHIFYIFDRKKSNLDFLNAFFAYFWVKLKMFLWISASTVKGSGNLLLRIG